MFHGWTREARDGEERERARIVDSSGVSGAGALAPTGLIEFDRQSIANANAARVVTTVWIDKVFAFDTAVTINRLIAGLIVTRATVIATMSLRADDRADGKTTDYARCDRATVTRGSRLWGRRQRQGDGRYTNESECS